MPDATGLELLAQELAEAHGDEPVVERTEHFRGKAALHVQPATIRSTLAFLRSKGFGFLASVHGLDYYPEEPRLGVHYELIDMDALDRITVKLRVPTDAPEVPSVVDDLVIGDPRDEATETEYTQ